MCLYALSALLVYVALLAKYLVYDVVSSEEFFTFAAIVVGIASFFFCAATIAFLSSICSVIKRHEYNELLLAKLVQEKEKFKTVQPSNKFIKRWNKNQNLIALFIILSLPMAISPFIAVRHVYNAIMTSGSYTGVVILFKILIPVFAGIFHIWGTQLLIKIYNEHLRTEADSKIKLEIDY